MSQVREIKCPNCGEWTMWAGDIDDRCLYCNSFLEPQRFSREVEKKVNKELLKENDYFFIKPTDGPLKRELKTFFNSIRWWVYYMQLLFFIFISLLLVLISLFAG
jgi:phage FluMu protein Com